MATSTESGRSPSINKENTSDIIQKLREDDSEEDQAADLKVLRRATLKIDSYLIPIVGLFCVFVLPFISASTTNCSPLVQISSHSW